RDLTQGRAATRANSLRRAVFRGVRCPRVRSPPAPPLQICDKRPRRPPPFLSVPIVLGLTPGPPVSMVAPCNRLHTHRSARISACVRTNSDPASSEGGTMLRRVLLVGGGLMFGLVLMALPAVAQITTGTVSGNVKDPSGAVVPGATVVLVSETRATRSAPAVTN